MVKRPVLNVFLIRKLQIALPFWNNRTPAHRDDTSSTRNISYAALISISGILLVIIFIIIILCRRLRRFVRERQSPALAAMQTSGLPQMHPMMNVLFQTLQRLDMIEQHARDRPSSHLFLLKYLLRLVQISINLLRMCSNFDIFFLSFIRFS